MQESLRQQKQETAQQSRSMENRMESLSEQVVQLRQKAGSDSGRSGTDRTELERPETAGCTAGTRIRTGKPGIAKSAGAAE